MFFPAPELYSDWKAWANALTQRLVEPAGMNGPVLLPTFTKTALPPAVQAGTLIFVTDEIGGSTVAFDDGAGAWRRVADRAVVA